MSTNNSRYNVLLDPSYVDALQILEPDLTVSQLARKAMRLLFKDAVSKWKNVQTEKWVAEGHPKPEFPTDELGVTSPEWKALSAWYDENSKMLKETMPAALQELDGLKIY